MIAGDDAEESLRAGGDMRLGETDGLDDGGDKVVLIGVVRGAPRWARERGGGRRLWPVCFGAGTARPPFSPLANGGIKECIPADDGRTGKRGCDRFEESEGELGLRFVDAWEDIDSSPIWEVEREDSDAMEKSEADPVVDGLRLATLFPSPRECEEDTVVDLERSISDGRDVDFLTERRAS